MHFWSQNGRKGSVHYNYRRNICEDTRSFSLWYWQCVYWKYCNSFCSITFNQVQMVATVMEKKNLLVTLPALCLEEKEMNRHLEWLKLNIDDLCKYREAGREKCHTVVTWIILFFLITPSQLGQQDYQRECLPEAFGISAPWWLILLRGYVADSRQSLQLP